MTPYECAAKLDIPLILDKPACYGPLWTGQALHVTYAEDHSEWSNGSQFRFRFLTDEEVFHELAHVLLASAKMVKEPDFGFDMDPITGWGINISARANQSQEEQDQEEHEADLLGDCLAFMCGVSQEWHIARFNELNASDDKYHARNVVQYKDRPEEIERLRTTPRIERKERAILSPRFWSALKDAVEMLETA